VLQTYRLTTPRGNSALLACRDDTSDLAIAGSVFGGVAGSPLVDEYDLGAEYITGVFVDVGAHIGAVTVAVLLDNPQARAICVEPIPDNVGVLRQNLELNGLTERATVIAAAVGTKTVRMGSGTERYVANMLGASGPETSVPKVTLRELVKEAGGEIELLKTDCEGGEWSLLRPLCVKHVERIVGEWHGRTEAELVELLAATHVVVASETHPGLGLFVASRK
jgi:FkbM family methyltransferase